MAPPRSKPQHDDSRSESSSTKEKAWAGSSNAPNGKARRVGGTAGTGSSLRDVVSAGQSSTAVENTETTPGTTVSRVFSEASLTNLRFCNRLTGQASMHRL
jgi:hypothetical protein